MKAKHIFPAIAASLLFVKCDCSNTAANLLFSEDDKYTIGVDFHNELAKGTRDTVINGKTTPGTPAAIFFELEKNKVWDPSGTKYESSADAKAVAAYIDSIGRKIVEQIDDEDWKSLLPYNQYSNRSIDKSNFFQFRVIKDSTINAFAVAGGKVYFYTGILKTMKSEAELIGVMSHEIGHVVRNHTAKRLASYYGTATLVSMLAGGEPGLLSQLGMMWFLNKNGQADELESDSLGVTYAAKAQINPSGVRTFFSKGLIIAPDGSCKTDSSFLIKLGESFSTHPADCKRVTQSLRLEQRYSDAIRNLPTRETEYNLGVKKSTGVLLRPQTEDQFHKNFLEPLGRL